MTPPPQPPTDWPAAVSLLARLHPPHSVVHVGSQPAAAPSRVWQQWGVPHALVVDPMAEDDATTTHPPGWHHSQAVLAGQAHSATPYYTVSLQAESGLLPPQALRALWPNLQAVGTQPRATTNRPPFDLPDTEKKYGNLTLTYASQLHIAVVEVDRKTFVPKILAYSAVDDCGYVINPKIVAGQVHGATAHGIGAAMMKAYVYDKEANLLTSSFTDYTPITVMKMPDLAFVEIETPSPFSYNGARGMGEGGSAPQHTISAALQDALHDQNVIIRYSHTPPSDILDLVKRADRSSFVKVERRA